jgi:cation diffusion facilitator family transporter
LVNAGQATLKMLVGAVGNSPALIADGVHSLGDLLCNFMVLFAARIAHADADHNHPYGHWRFETIGTLILGIFLLAVGFGIAYDGVINIIHGETAKPGLYTIWAAVISIIANEILFRYTLKTANRINSDLLRANAWHSRGDSLSSVIVLVGLLGAIAGWTFLDAVAAIAVALFIGKMGVEWGWQAVMELTDAGLDEEELAEIRDTILTLPGVVHMHQLRTRKMAGKVFLDVHILILPYTSASEGHLIAEEVRVTLIRQFDAIEDVLVHIDVDEHPEQLPEKLPISRDALLARLLPRWQAIVPANSIYQVTLHYLRGVQIEVQLGLELLEKQKLEASLLQKAFVDSIRDQPEVKSIRLLFTENPAPTFTVQH